MFRRNCYILRDRENFDKFEVKSDLEIFLGYSINSRAYHVYNLRASTIMESINVVIYDSRAITLVEFKDGDIFGDYSSSENFSDNVEAPFTITLGKPPKITKENKKNLISLNGQKVLILLTTSLVIDVLKKILNLHDLFALTMK